MKIKLTRELIQSLHFEDTFEGFFTTDLFRSPGKEHYRLLAYLSTLFQDTHILDIGTHQGTSALALSYNPTNTVYSFDIVHAVSENYKQRPNLRFIMENIVNDENKRDRWKTTILSSAFIFLDVDPHNGYMEYDFYLFLKENHYKGFVVCDDIWYFKEMRDHFWYKIEDHYRYDISEYGHWSGTGVITLNQDITLDKKDNSNWTLVTAYFNLTKCPDASEEIRKRDSKYYFSHSISTLSLPYHLVIYCDAESHQEIVKIRPVYLKDKTRYVIREFDTFTFHPTEEEHRTFAQYRDIIRKNREKKPYHFDSRNTASYYLFCMSRYIMLKETIEQNPFQSTHFGWINFCIERMGFRNLKYLDEALSVRRDKFSTCYIDYVPQELVNNTDEYYRWGRCGMCSGFFTGNKEYMYKVCDLVEKKFIHYTNLGYGHADEQLFSPVYFENPELFEHYYGDYQQMVTNYAFVHEAPEAPIRNFIRNSYENKNYEKCLEACNYLLTSFKLKKIELDMENTRKLTWYYDKSVEQLKQGL